MVERAQKTQSQPQSETALGLIRAFEMFDKDRGGTIDRNEFLQVMTRPVKKSGKDMAPILTKDQAEMIFDEMDQDGGGTVCLEEFVAAWADVEATYVGGRLNHVLNPAFKKGKSVSRMLNRGKSFFQRSSHS